MYDMNRDIDHILVSEQQLRDKVAELGAAISRDYAGRDLLLVSILKGAVVFMADLMRAVTIPCGIDFMVVSSYGGANTTTTGLVKIIKDLDQDLTGKDVLIVEDILDTGVTLSHLVPMLQMRNPQQRQDLRHPLQAQPPPGGHRTRLQRLRRPRRVRGGLRPGLRRKIPQSSVRGRSQAPGVQQIKPAAAGEEGRLPASASGVPGRGTLKSRS